MAGAQQHSGSGQPTIDIPTFYTVIEPMSDEEAEQHTHSWRTCGSCGYVLCSCGGCHSQQCGEMCIYDETSEGS